MISPLYLPFSDQTKQSLYEFGFDSSNITLITALDNNESSYQMLSLVMVRLLFLSHLHSL